MVKMYSRVRKYAKKARKGVRSLAKTYLNVARSGAVKNYRKTGKWSSTAIAKSLTNLSRKVGASAEYKLLDEAHTTGSPDISTRQYFAIQASATEASVGNTVTPGTPGYFLAPITLPTRGDGESNFDGKKYSVESIQWKGSLYNMGHDATANMYIIQYSDEDNDAFKMEEFFNADPNGEYSTACKRTSDFKGYRVVAQRTIKFSSGGTLRKDFNIIARPKKLIKIQENDDFIHSATYHCLIVVSGDVSTRVSTVHYIGNTRMRFIH